MSDPFRPEPTQVTRISQLESDLGYARDQLREVKEQLEAARRNYR